MIVDARPPRRARRSWTATASSSPRRSCRRPRTGSCRSTTTTSTARRALVERESRADPAPPRRPDHQRDEPRLRVRERRASTCRTSTTATPRCCPSTATGRHTGSGSAIRAAAGVDVAVVISDTFGRAWRHGLTDVAIGVAGLAAVVDLRGETDALGRELHVTEVAVADEVAGAAELVMGKATAVPVAIVRGLEPDLVPRRLGQGAHPRRRGTTCSDEREPMSVPAFLEARRSIRAFTDEPVDRATARRARRGRVHRAGAAPLPAVALRRGRHRRRPSATSPTGMGARWRADLAADGVARGARRRAASTRRTARSRARRRSCSAASPGTGSTATPTRPASGPSGAWRCCRSAPRSRTSWSPHADAGLASCWVAAPIFCPEAARDALVAPRRVAPPRARARRPPRPGLRRARAACRSTTPPLRAEAARHVPVRGSRPSRGCSSGFSARRGPGTTRACAPTPVVEVASTASSRGGSRPGPGRATSVAARPARAGAWFGSLREAGRRARSSRRAPARSSRPRSRC